MIVVAADDDDDFGDFGNFDTPTAPQQPKTTMIDTGEKKETSDDNGDEDADWGDFETFEDPSDVQFPTMLVSSGKKNVTDASDDSKKQSVAE